MFKIVPFKKEHLEVMLTQPTHIEAGILTWYESGNAERMEKLCSFTGLWNGVPLICGGVIDYWENRGQLWSWFNAETPKMAFPAVIRGIKKFLAAQPYNRVEMCHPVGDDQLARRALLLGFKLECSFARSYLPDGTDCALYSLVRK